MLDTESSYVAYFMILCKSNESPITFSRHELVVAVGVAEGSRGVSELVGK